MRAAAAGLDVTGETIGLDPVPALHALAQAGIDVRDVTDKLLRDGIDGFVRPMDKLLAAIGAVLVST